LSAIALLLPLALADSPARAAVTTSGSVLNNPPVGGGSFPSTEVTVGDANDDVSSILGTMRIDNGTDLLLDKLIIGDEAAYIGDVVVTGAGTTLTMDSSFVSNPALQVGHEGTGYLTISQQAAVHVSNSSGNLVIGRDATSAGFVTVDGLLTQLTFGEDLLVGDMGYGELKLTGGALVYATDLPGSTATIGASVGSVGSVEVDGARTLWQLPETVSIGVVGAGMLRISNEAVVDGNDGASSGITVGTRGAIELDNGRLLADKLTVNGRLRGDGLVTGPVTIGVAGEVGAGAGERLRLAGAVTNAGVVNVSGNSTALAEVEFVGALTNSNGSPLQGRIAVGDGVVRFLQPLSNNGTLASTSGVANFHGNITNSATGVVAIGGGSHATFYGDVDVTNGVLSISAGSTALFLSDINISAGAALAFELNGSFLEEGFNTPLQGVGSAAVDAPISLTLAEGFVPMLGDEFELISTAQGLSIGAVDLNNFEPLPTGLQWDVLVSGETLTAVVIQAGLPGDYNDDGAVDAADYTVWRDNLGAPAGTLVNDPNPGAIGAAQYTTWKTNYGNTSASPGAFEAAAVPEPCGVALLGLGCLLVLGGFRRGVA
jgi:T5SS/PEP-CTERM-associated repeat protein